MLELFSLTDLTGTLSYAVIALSYLMTRIFWLRVVAVVGPVSANRLFPPERLGI